MRETFAAPAKGHGRHVKQSGGHGQYAICDIEVEPLPQGAGFEFVDKVVGGAVPRQFIGSVEKGVRAQMQRGVAKGYPVVDIRVTLTDGKSHSVDSSDAAFQSAGALALREAARETTIALLEPYDEVEVVVPDDHLGAVMSDLSSRRGHLLGTDKVDAERTAVRAHVPQTELVRYAVELRGSTHGSGTFTRSFAHHEAMPERPRQRGRPAQLRRALRTGRGQGPSRDSKSPMSAMSLSNWSTFSAAGRASTSAASSAAARSILARSRPSTPAAAQSSLAAKTAVGTTTACR